MKTMSIALLIILMGASVVAAKESAIEKEFKKAISGNIEEKKIGWIGIFKVKFPMEYKSDYTFHLGFKEQFSLLVEKGLIIPVDTAVGDNNQELIQYELTDSGKSISTETSTMSIMGKNESTQFKCFDVKLKAIDFYTEPSNGPNGIKISNVKYIVEKGALKDWCNDPRVIKAFQIERQVESKIDTNKITLFKSNKGWLPISKLQ